MVSTASTPYFGGGGKGFGAGGGGGGFAGNTVTYPTQPGNGWRFAGGNGTNGLVYIEWD